MAPLMLGRYAAIPEVKVIDPPGPIWAAPCLASSHGPSSLASTTLRAASSPVEAIGRGPPARSAAVVTTWSTVPNSAATARSRATSATAVRSRPAAPSDRRSSPRRRRRARPQPGRGRGRSRRRRSAPVRARSEEPLSWSCAQGALGPASPAGHAAAGSGVPGCDGATHGPTGPRSGRATPDRLPGAPRQQGPRRPRPADHDRRRRRADAHGDLAQVGRYLRLWLAAGIRMERGGRLWASEVVALERVAAELLEAALGLLVLDALGDDLQAEGVADVDGGPDDGRVAGVLAHLLDERLVDLEDVDRQPLQVA